jgi:hypothetical protein
VKMPTYSPSICLCRGHSAGRTRMRVTPRACGRRPSFAALTRSGAMKASEIVMLTCRVLQPSRTAILSALAVGSVVISLSQRRPCAIDALSNARFSERMGRASGASGFWHHNLTATSR